MSICKTLCGAKQQVKRHWAETLSQKAPPKYEKELLYCVGYSALAQIAQKSSGFSLTGDIQEPFGHNPVLYALE